MTATPTHRRHHDGLLHMVVVPVLILSGVFLTLVSVRQVVDRLGDPPMFPRASEGAPRAVAFQAFLEGARLVDRHRQHRGRRGANHLGWRPLFWILV